MNASVNAKDLYQAGTWNCTERAVMNASVNVRKTKLVKGLQIEDSRIRKIKQDDRHVCDICARAKITRQPFKKIAFNP